MRFIFHRHIVFRDERTRWLVVDAFHALAIASVRSEHNEWAEGTIRFHEQQSRRATQTSSRQCLVFLPCSSLPFLKLPNYRDHYHHFHRDNFAFSTLFDVWLSHHDISIFRSICVCGGEPKRIASIFNSFFIHPLWPFHLYAYNSITAHSCILFFIEYSRHCLFSAYAMDNIRWNIR